MAIIDVFFSTISRMIYMSIVVGFRSRKNILNQTPSEHHMVAKASGGIAQLFREIKTHTVPSLQCKRFITFYIFQCLIHEIYRCE